MQLEYRETTDLYRLFLMLNGGNLYDLSNMPVYQNQYGFLYVHLNYLLSFLFSPSIYSLRIVTAFFIVGSCILIYGVVYKLTSDYLISILGALIYYLSSIMHNGNVGAFPNTMGEFLFLSSIILPWLCSFSTLSLLASIVLGILSFYTKIYFLFGIIFLNGYLFFFHSKRTALAFFFLWVLMLTLSISFISLYYPSYISSTIIVSYNAAEYSLKHLIAQAGMFFALYFSLTIQFVRRLYSKMRGVHEYSNADGKYYLMCFLFSLVVMIRFGGNRGAFLLYPIHLTLPFLLIYALSIMNKRRLTVILMLLNILILCAKCIDVDFMKNRNFPMLERLIQSSNSPLTSPAVSLLVMRNKKTVYDSGQTEYYRYGGRKAELQFDKYLSQVKCGIKERKFDLIAAPDYGTPIIDIDLVKQNYKKGESFTITMYKRKWPISVWYPKGKEPSGY